MATAPCQYRIGPTLGSGSYAVVKEVIHITTKQYYACKVISKKLMAGREKIIINEIRVLEKISQGHPNIVKLVDYFETTSSLYIVTDLCLGGELFDRICSKKYFHEKDAAKLVRSVTDAVNYLHAQGVVHRDLKPENLLFKSKDKDSELLVADFGLSKVLEDDIHYTLTTTCGTPAYMAPEIFKHRGYGKPVDMWAIGVITYFLLCGYTPFDRASQVEEIQAVCTADFAFEPAEYWVEVSQTARDFVSALLVVEPSERLTAAQALAHPFLAGDAVERGADLLPTFNKNAAPKAKLLKGLNAIRAAHTFQEGGENNRKRHQMDLDDGQRHIVEKAEGARKEAEKDADEVAEVTLTRQDGQT